MKNYSLLFGLTCFLFSTLFSQSMQWGEEIARRSGASGIYNIVGSIGDNIVAEHYFEAGTINGIKTGRDKYSLVLFDKQNNLLKSEEVNLNVDKKTLDYHSAKILNERLYVFSEFSNSKLKQKFLFATELDTKTLKPLGNPQKIAETFLEKTKLGIFQGFYTPEGQFFTEVSNNSSYMAVLSIADLEKDEASTYNLLVYDEGMELVWKKRIDRASPEGTLFLSSMTLDGSGNAYFIVRQIATEDRRNEQPTQIGLSIKAYRYKGNESESYEVVLSPNEVNFSSRLSISDQNDVIYTSLSGTRNPEKRNDVTTEGIRYIMIDGSTSEVRYQKHVLFDEKTLEEMKDLITKKGKLEPSRITLSDIWIGENNDIYLLGEEFQRTSSTEITGYTSNSNYYHYKDIFVWKISPEKGLDWMKRIEKDQTIAQWFPSTGGTYSFFIDQANRLRGFGGSFFSMMNEKGIHILFSEKTTKGRALPKWTYGYIDAEGELKTRILSKDLPQRGHLIPASSRNLGTEKIILLANQRKKYQIGRVSFE